MRCALQSEKPLEQAMKQNTNGKKSESITTQLKCVYPQQTIQMIFFICTLLSFERYLSFVIECDLFYFEIALQAE